VTVLVAACRRGRCRLIGVALCQPIAHGVPRPAQKT
jgi:hypothetical protein